MPQGQPTILLIEDDPRYAEDLMAVLVKEGFRVKTASDGESGLELARKESPDLILLDLVLPKKDGFEVLREMRKNPGILSIPVIILTNIESSDAVNRVIALGASTYLVKTYYNTKDIVEKVKTLLTANRKSNEHPDTRHESHSA